MKFRIDALESGCGARATTLTTDRGEIHTPVFMPVGTQGTVKALEQRALLELDAGIILANTYHLYLRPGEEVLSCLGGLHAFMNWSRPILTDSGGFQVFSLKDLRKITEDGVQFASHLDGSRHIFTPERVVEIQRCIGSDIMMVLDECTPFPATEQYARDSMQRSERWAARSRNAWLESAERYGKRQFLFAIGQGSVYPQLRRDNMQALVELDLPGYAIGGLSVGEDTEQMYAMVEATVPEMPVSKPRYLMGVGTPQNLLECVERGVDMFDCVMPTRNARNGQIFTSKGKVNIRNQKYKFAEEALDSGLDNYVSQNFSRAYLRHLFNVNEILGLQLATYQNIAFYLWLMHTARAKILAGEFRHWKRAFLESYGETG